MGSDSENICEALERFTSEIERMEQNISLMIEQFKNINEFVGHQLNVLTKKK